MDNLFDRTLTPKDRIALAIAQEIAVLVVLRNTSTAEVLLRQNIGRHLRPMDRNLDTIHLEHHRTVRVAEHRRPRGVLEHVVGTFPCLSETTVDFHGSLLGWNASNGTNDRRSPAAAAVRLPEMDSEAERRTLKNRH